MEKRTAYKLGRILMDKLLSNPALNIRDERKKETVVYSTDTVCE